MSFAFIVMTMLLGSSTAMAFALQPSEEEPAASGSRPVSYQRCQAASSRSIREDLLASLNLEAEPRLPAGGLDGIRAQWRSAFPELAHRGVDAAGPAVSVPHDDGNNASLKCCSTASEIFMSDLGWDNWVIHPTSLAVVQCEVCSLEGGVAQCPSAHGDGRADGSQAPCCQPTSHKWVPIIYVDEVNTVVISSVRVADSCGCGDVN